VCLTGDGGTWGYVTKPTIRTSYEASWKNAASPAAAVGVRPLVLLRVGTRARLSTRVVAQRSFTGRIVQREQLAPDQRDVLLLRVLGELTVEEVAGVIGKSPGAVKALQRRGLAAIKLTLAKEGVTL
jgi:hypothetical protein